MRMCDINEAAKQLNLCRQTIYKLIREGELSAKKSSSRGKWLIPADSIEKYIKSDDVLIEHLIR